MTVTFDQTNDASGLQAAVAYAREQGSVTVDDNWSEIQKKAFATVSSSLGFSDPELDGTYKYDGVTKSELTPEALQAAANDVVVEHADEAQSGAQDVQGLSDTVDQTIAAYAGNGLPVLGDSTGLVSSISSDAVNAVGKALVSAASQAPGAAQSGIDAVTASAQQTREAASSVKAAGYVLTEGTEAAVGNTDQAIKDAEEDKGRIDATVANGFSASANDFIGNLSRLLKSGLESTSQQMSEIAKKMTGEA